MDEERREVLDALSDKTRLAILEAVSERPMTGDEISEAVQRSRSTVESHLSMLLRLGLIARTKDDKRYYYQSTEKAKAWMASSGGASTQSSPEAAKKGKVSPILIVIIVGTLAGAYYALVNTFLVPFPIWLFAAIVGIACAWICSTLRRLLQIFLVASLVTAVLSAAVGLGQMEPVTVLILFAFCIAFLVVIGLPLWYVTRKLRVILSSKGKKG